MPSRGPAIIVSNAISKNNVFMDTPTGYEATVVSGMEPSYLKTQEPSDVARIASLYPEATAWIALFGGSSGLGSLVRDIDGMALVNSNLSPWGLYRFIGSSSIDPLATMRQQLPPISVISSTNMTGGFGDVDESPAAPDANYMAPTDVTLAWSVRIEFADAASNPPTGAHRCRVTAFVKMFGTQVSAYPSVTCSLYQGATLVGSLGSRAITETGGQLLIFTFDAASLPNSSGDDLRAHFAFSKGATNGGTDVYAKLGAVELVMETPVPESFTVFNDSGWLSSLSSGDEDDGPAPSVDLPHWPASTWADVEYLVVYIMDDQVEHDPTLHPVNSYVATGDVDNIYLSGFVEAGVLVAGPALFINSSILGDNTPGGNVIVEQLGDATVGGQTFGADAYRRRVLSVQLTLTRDQLLVLQDRIAWRRGKAGAFYFASEPDIPTTRQKFTSGWFTLVSMSDPTRLPQQAYDGGDGTLLFVTTLVIEQKL